MEEIKLSAEKRAQKGTKKDLSSLRLQSRVPAIVYGEGKPEIMVSVAEKDILAARKKGGINAILHLDVGGSAETVIIKELQRHPVTERISHADFQRISLSRKITAKVPLRIVGEAPGVKNSGGVLQHELRELTLRALPASLPQFVDVDVSGLDLNKHLAVKDLKISGDIEILEDPEHMVVHVSVAKVEAAAEAPAAAEAGAAAPAAEPELSQVKGKKDEEGKPLPKEGKEAKEGGAAPQAKAPPAK